MLWTRRAPTVCGENPWFSALSKLQPMENGASSRATAQADRVTAVSGSGNSASSLYYRCKPILLAALFR